MQENSSCGEERGGYQMASNEQEGCPHLGVEDVLVDRVLHAQHLHVRAQRHLAHTVCVEVELVLLEVVKVLDHRQQDLQRLRKGTALYAKL